MTGARLVLRDGVHILDPQSSHHAHLARHGLASCMQGKMLLAADWGRIEIGAIITAPDQLDSGL